MYWLKILFLFCFVLSGCKNQDKEVDSIMEKIILIDPGHGGRDNGTSFENVLEDEINLSVGLLLQQLLLEEGVFTLITRTGDYDLSSLNASNHKAQDLKNRIKMINDNDVDLFVSLHLNAYLDESVRGAQVFYQKDNENSKYFAEVLQSEVNKLYEKQRKIKVGDYYILENSERTGVLIEMGFLSSPLDRRKLTDINHQRNIAKAIFDSFKTYFRW